MNNVRKDKLTRRLEEIARGHLFLEDLDTRNTGEDFKEQAVAYGGMVGGYALIKRGIAAVPQVAQIHGGGRHAAD